MKLSAGQIENPLWKEIARALTVRLQELRVQNDKPSLSENETADLRGRIAEVKAMLKWAEVVPLTEPMPDPMRT